MAIEFTKIKIEDCDFILKIRNDDSTRHFLHNSQKFSKSEFQKWFNKENPEWIKVAHDGVPVGYMRTVVNYPDIEIGMDLCPTHRGKGYAKAAYEKLLKNLKFKLYRKATLRVLKSNTVAFNLYKKLGFETKEETNTDFYMELQLNKRVGKSAKVICTWYGARRGAFSGEYWRPEHNIKMFNYWWDVEKKLAYGSPMDIILINNSFKEPSECDDFINSLEGVSTPNGVVKTFSRPNIGGSFGAFDFIFDKFKNDYDYWFFLEDDHIILKNGILADALEQFKALDAEIGFYGVVGCQETHCNGGCGITSRSILEDLEKLNYSHFLMRNALPFYGAKGLTRQHEIEGEVPFTNLIKKKLELKLYCPKIENMILSWKQTKKRGIEFPARVVTHDERFKI